MAVSPWPPSVAGARRGVAGAEPRRWPGRRHRYGGAASFGVQAARCLVLAYDYTVFAGTQGVMNHKKTDRLLGLAEQWRLPLVLFAEGGGGRPGDTDFVGVAGLDCHTFVGMARLSGLVPLVGVVSGRCFAGNAALLGCCDVIIATRDATIGMAGPAMIGAAAWAVSPPRRSVRRAQAQRSDRRTGGGRGRSGRGGQALPRLFPGPLPDWSCADQRELRHLVPENRLRAYDIRQAIEVLADRAACWNCGASSLPAWSPRCCASRAGRSA